MLNHYYVVFMPELVAVGHVLMDTRIFVKEFPKADEEAKTNKLSFGGGGSAANAAVGASRLGVKAGFVGAIGFDTYGRILLEELEHEGVNVTHVKVDTSTSSGLNFIAVNKMGQVMVFGYTGASDKLLPSEIDTEYTSSAENVHITGISFNTAIETAKIASESRVLISFDPGRLISKLGLEKISFILKYVDQILLNHEEAEKLTGKTRAEDAAEILLKKGPKIVEVKRGEEGVFAMTSKSKFHIPVYNVERARCRGCGYNRGGGRVLCGFYHRSIRGKRLEESVKFANATANLKITKIGARALPTRKTVERFIMSNRK